jgi:hypothetical protein
VDNNYCQANRNVAQIYAQGSRLIHGRIPAQVRRELVAAVRAGVLHRLPKDGLKPEVFFDPRNRGSAVEIRERYALYSIRCIQGVVA